MHHLYKVINQINGKIYIGQTSNLSKRWNEHKFAVKNNRPMQIIHHAFIKYGLDNFKFEHIASCQIQAEANEIETLLILQEDSFVPNGYNSTLGGANAPKTEEQKRKISASLMGHFVSEETKKKQSVSHKGIKRTEDIKLKISKALIGNTHASGQVPWNKKFSREEEIVIANDTRPSRAIAKEYGINKSTVLDIRNRYKL
jgi:group I intron endonuclease